jgi:hypothetical protein
MCKRVFRGCKRLSLVTIASTFGGPGEVLPLRGKMPEENSKHEHSDLKNGMTTNTPFEGVA